MEINANVTGMRIMTSERQRIAPVRGGTRHPMRWGDRIFVRIIRGASCIDDFLSTRVADFTELLGEIRSRLRGIRGLVEMQVRNASEGWSIRRPLMLYNDNLALSSSPATINAANDAFVPRGFGNLRLTEPITPRISSMREKRIFTSTDTRKSPQMLKPYETH